VFFLGASICGHPNQLTQPHIAPECQPGGKKIKKNNKWKTRKSNSQLRCFVSPPKQHTHHYAEKPNVCTCRAWVEKNGPMREKNKSAGRKPDPNGLVGACHHNNNALLLGGRCCSNLCHLTKLRVQPSNAPDKPEGSENGRSLTVQNLLPPCQHIPTAGTVCVSGALAAGGVRGGTGYFPRGGGGGAGVRGRRREMGARPGRHLGRVRPNTSEPLWQVAGNRRGRPPPSVRGSFRGRIRPPPPSRSPILNGSTSPAPSAITRHPGRNAHDNKRVVGEGEPACRRYLRRGVRILYPPRVKP